MWGNLKSVYIAFPAGFLWLLEIRLGYALMAASLEQKPDNLLSVLSSQHYADMVNRNPVFF